MKTNQIIVDAQKTLGTNMRITGMREVFKYENGERTNEQDGYRYEVVLLDRSFEKISFKVANNNELFTPEQIENNIAVKAIKPEISLYPNYSGGEVGVIATAESLVALNDE